MSELSTGRLWAAPPESEQSCEAEPRVGACVELKARWRMEDLDHGSVENEQGFIFLFLTTARFSGESE